MSVGTKSGWCGLPSGGCEGASGRGLYEDGALEVGLGGQAIAEGGEGHGPDHALGEHMAMLVRSGRVSRPI